MRGIDEFFDLLCSKDEYESNDALECLSEKIWRVENRSRLIADQEELEPAAHYYDT